MGLYDRDWYTERRHFERKKTHLLTHPLIWMAAALVFVWLVAAPGTLNRIRTRLAAAIAPQEPAATPVPDATPVLQRAETREASVVSPPPPRPHRFAADEVPWPSQNSARGEAATTPGTIYRCRSYGGQLFWSQAHCQQQRALIDRIASVPPGMPFDQQVTLAQRDANEMAASIRADEQRAARQTLCGALQTERDRIWSRHKDGQYQPPEVSGPDQTRWRQIETLLNQNGCLRR